MRNLLVFIFLAAIISSCGPGQNGELIGVQGRRGFQDPTPYGMVFVPMGKFKMGSDDKDITWAVNAPSRVVSIDAFWMDQTEITNNQYRQFVYYVRDSISRRLLSQQIEDLDRKSVV